VLYFQSYEKRLRNIAPLLVYWIPFTIHPFGGQCIFEFYLEIHNSSLNILHGLAIAIVFKEKIGWISKHSQLEF